MLFSSKTAKCATINVCHPDISRTSVDVRELQGEVQVGVVGTQQHTVSTPHKIKQAKQLTLEPVDLESVSESSLAFHSGHPFASPSIEVKPHWLSSH